MPSNHLILCHPLLLLRSIFPSFRAFSNESLLASNGPSIEVSASVLPMNIQGCFPLGLTGLVSLQSRRLSKHLLQGRFSHRPFLFESGNGKPSARASFWHLTTLKHACVLEDETRDWSLCSTSWLPARVLEGPEGPMQADRAQSQTQPVLHRGDSG